MAGQVRPHHANAVFLPGIATPLLTPPHQSAVALAVTAQRPHVRRGGAARLARPGLRWFQGRYAMGRSDKERGRALLALSLYEA